MEVAEISRVVVQKVFVDSQMFVRIDGIQNGRLEGPLRGWG